VSLPASAPESLRRWYGRAVGVGAADHVRLGESRLRFHRVEDVTASDATHDAESAPDADTATDSAVGSDTPTDGPPPAHLAVRTTASPSAVAAWVRREATHCPIDGEPSRRFDFLDAEAVYGLDPAGNVLEWLCERGSARSTAPAGDDPAGATAASTASPAGPACGGLTEVGLPAPEPTALVAWLTDTVGLPTWGTPSGSFAWVGDRTARFVVIPADTDWYPTDRTAGVAALTATVVDSDATPGTHSHPELPYEISVIERERSD
jgi:hypothetical protein